MIGICSDEAVQPFVAELKAMGIQPSKMGYRAVHFSATPRQFYQLHLTSRYASRLLATVKSVPAGSDRILFDKARRIRWPDWFRANVPVAFEVYQQAKEQSRIAKDLAGSKIREALTDSFKHFDGAEPCLRSKDAQLKVIIFMDGNRSHLSLETSGAALHKRGYRIAGHPATLKETLAAALLWHCGYDPSKPLVDLCCGSGTILMEAALEAKQIAPGLLRSRHGFGCEELKWFQHAEWRALREETQSLQQPARSHIIGIDIEPDFVDFARRAAAKAKVQDAVSVECRDLFSWAPPAGMIPGLVLSNLPYGDRLEQGDGSEQAATDFFNRLGRHLKDNFHGWRVGLLGRRDAPWPELGMRPSKKVAMNNGGLDVSLRIFDIFPAKPAMPEAGEAHA